MFHQFHQMLISQGLEWQLLIQVFQCYVTCLTGDLNIADPPVTSPAPEVPPNKLSRVLLTGAELEYIPVCDGGARGSSGSSRLISFSVPSVAEK
jgi:hypothetical protein